MSSKKTIAIDLDDVIADSTESLRLLVNNRTGSNLTKEHYQVEGDYWGYYERVWLRHGIADKVDFDSMNDEMVIDQSHVPLLAGAAFAIGELSKKFNLIIITSRDINWEKATKKWLKDHFGELFNGIHFTNGHGELSKSKGELCRELNVDYMIDDNPGHCLSALKNGVKPILFGKYGWHTSIPERLISCKDWPEVLDYFNERS